MSVLLELTRIVQAASEAENGGQQVAVIVDSITRAVHVDVCSLYLAAPDGWMTLAASHGLSNASVGHTRLPPGKGLVGRVVASRRQLSIASARTHPDFLHLADTGEDEFQSFFGVPLVRAGDVIGVLVVQSRRARELGDEEQAFLVTLAAQLALVVSRESELFAAGADTPLTVCGVRGASGIGIGQTRLTDDNDLLAVSDAPCTDIEGSVAQWHALVTAVRRDVKEEQAALGTELSQEVGAVFDAYQMLLADPSLVHGVEQAIRAGHALPGALRSVIAHYANLFKAMDDPYLQARHEDIQHLGNKLYRSWRGHSGETTSPDFQTEPLVLVGRQISISDLARHRAGELAGIVCFEGSTLSHTAVLANALGIPAVMGIGEPRSISEGEHCIVDGNSGQCIFRPSDAVLREYRRLAQAESRLHDEMRSVHDQPGITRDGQRVQLLANSGLLADISPGLANGAEGLGLYRTEIPFMVSETFPSEEQQVALYSQVMEAYAGKPVYMRILDIGGDKPLPYFPFQEENPALGWRGIRFCLDNSSLLITQLRAVLRAGAGGDGLRLLLPMVSATAELDAFSSLLDEVCDQLHAEGIQARRPPVGIMVEVPAAISQLKFWRKKLDFVSIGTNDLTQYLLAMDRNNARISARYDSLHPAVLNEVARIIGICADTALPVSVCGEMASEPAAAYLLIGLGVRSLSLSAAQLPRIRWMIRQMDAGTAQETARKALAMDNAGAIRLALRDAFQSDGLSAMIGD